jgi:hypothetical protein
MDADDPVRAPKTERRARARAQISALRGETGIPQLRHQIRPNVRDAECVHARLGQPVRESEPRQRRYDDVERIGQQRNDPQHLEERSGPPVR